MRFLAVFVWVATIAAAREAHVTVLATTDLHGNVYPWDYNAGKPSARGLAKIATLIAEQRKTAPRALLVDSGDTIQGTPLETLWQNFRATGKLPLNLRFSGSAPTSDPMMLAMNHLRYDAMAVGNHEFNFGLEALDRARADARFPWLSANTKASGKRKPFEPWIIREVDGVRVAIVGLTTPAIPNWEKPENFAGYSFLDLRATAKAVVTELRSKHACDLVLFVTHAGVDRDLKTGVIRTMDLPGENMMYEIAEEVPGIDAITYGHTHQEVAELRVNGVLLTQPKNWGMSLARLDFDLESKPGGGWQVRSKTSQLFRVTEQTTADAEILRLAEPYHKATESWLDSAVGRSPVDLSATEGRIRDTAIIDAIQEVQLHYAKADVSFASAFNTRASIPKGPVTVRGIAGLYIYDNELYAIQGNGRMVREALENSARYFHSCTAETCPSPLVNSGFLGFNFDMAQGVSYEIDLTGAPGNRIRNLRFRGKPLADDQPLRIALNNYRAGGSGGYTMFRGAKLLWRSFEEIRDLMMAYFGTHPLPAAGDNNWKITPEIAFRQLERETKAEASRPLTQ